MLNDISIDYNVSIILRVILLTNQLGGNRCDCREGGPGSQGPLQG